MLHHIHNLQNEFKFIYNSIVGTFPSLMREQSPHNFFLYYFVSRIFHSYANIVVHITSTPQIRIDVNETNAGLEISSFFCFFFFILLQNSLVCSQLKTQPACSCVLVRFSPALCVSRIDGMLNSSPKNNTKIQTYDQILR